MIIVRAPNKNFFLAKSPFFVLSSSYDMFTYFQLINKLKYAYDTRLSSMPKLPHELVFTEFITGQYCAIPLSGKMNNSNIKTLWLVNTTNIT